MKYSVIPRIPPVVKHGSPTTRMLRSFSRAFHHLNVTAFTAYPDDRGVSRSVDSKSTWWQSTFAPRPAQVRHPSLPPEP